MLEGFLILIAAGLLAFGFKYRHSYQKYKADKTLHQLASMNRRDFEIYISKILKKQGWEKIKVGKGSQDGGYDVSGFVN